MGWPRARPELIRPNIKVRYISPQRILAKVPYVPPERDPLRETIATVVSLPQMPAAYGIVAYLAYNLLMASSRAQ